MRSELRAVDPFDSSLRDEVAVEWLRAQAAERKRREERLNQVSVAAVFVSGFASILSASSVASKYLLVVAPWGVCMGLLAIRPVEAQTISRSIACTSYLYAAYTVLAAPLIRASLQAGDWIDVVLTVLKVISALGTSAGLQMETFGKRESRQQLQRLWLSLKVNCIVHGVSEILHHAWYSPSQYVGLVTGLSFMLLVACIGNAHRRGTAIRALDAFLAPGSAVARREQAAAFLSSMTSAQLDVVKAYLSAKERFRCLPVQSLHRSLLAELPETPTAKIAGEKKSHKFEGILEGVHAGAGFATAAIMSATRPATLGEVDAFVSYAWQDCGDVMYDAVQAWASATRRRRGLSHTEELTVWLDRACLRGGSEITVLLACLPIFLAGCEQLLVLAGPTFSSRLWCATELFAFIRSACNAPRRQAARPAERADPDSLLFLLTGAYARARLGLACVCVCVCVCLQWGGLLMRSTSASYSELVWTGWKRPVRSRPRSRNSTPRRPSARWRGIGIGSSPSSRRPTGRSSPLMSSCETCSPQSWPPLPPLTLRLRAPRPTRRAPRRTPRHFPRAVPR